MYGILLGILVLDGFFLGIVILLQSGKGGGLAAVGGGTAMTEGILAGRQATTVLTRATWISGSVFMVLAFVLAIMSSRAVQPTSILRDDVQTAPIPQPVLPGIEGATEGPPSETPPGGGDPGEPGTL